MSTPPVRSALVAVSTTALAIVVLACSSPSRAPAAPASAPSPQAANPVASAPRVAPPRPNPAVDDGAPRLVLADGTLTLNGGRSSPDIVAYTTLRQLRDTWRKSATPGQAFHGEALITLAGAATVDQLLATLWSAFRSGYPNLMVELGGERMWLGWQLPPPGAPAQGEPIGPETLAVAPPVDNSFVVVLDDAECVIQSKLDPSAPVSARAPGVAPSFDPAAHATLALQVRDAWLKAPSPPKRVHVVVQIKRVADARAVVAALLALARELPGTTAIDVSPVGHERAL